MGEVLSQSEIDALLNALDSGELDVEEINEFLVGEVGCLVDSMLNERLLSILSTLNIIGFTRVCNLTNV